MKLRKSQLNVTKNGGDESMCGLWWVWLLDGRDYGYGKADIERG